MCRSSVLTRIQQFVHLSDNHGLDTHKSCRRASLHDQRDASSYNSYHHVRKASEKTAIYNLALLPGGISLSSDLLQRRQAVGAGCEGKRAEGASTDFAPTLINQYGVWACPPQTVLDRRTCISVRPRLDSRYFAYICCPEKTSTMYH